jgi:hypothetical protein
MTAWIVWLLSLKISVGLHLTLPSTLAAGIAARRERIE